MTSMVYLVDLVMDAVVVVVVQHAPASEREKQLPNHGCTVQIPTMAGVPHLQRRSRT